MSRPMNGSCGRMGSHAKWYHEWAENPWGFCWRTSFSPPLRAAMLLYSKLLAAQGFAHAFPTRDIRDADLYAFLGTDRVVQVKQVHGGRVVGANAPHETEA